MANTPTSPPRRRWRNGGGTKHPLYSTWQGMLERCLRKCATGYHYYGGRGIRVCDEWRSLYNFATWAADNGYQPGLTLDRINNDGDYEPSNCRWATPLEQGRNKRNNIWLTIDGVRYTAAEAARKFGLSRQVVCLRVKNGDTGKDAVRPPYARKAA